MTMLKLETMIYASEDGTSSVFTLNPALQKQLDSMPLQRSTRKCASGSQGAMLAE